MAELHQLAPYRRVRTRTFFNRSELSQMLAIYAEHVASGEWRDYAIDHAQGMAVFSIFRHTSEAPLYSVVKFAGRGGQPPEYAVFSGPRRLARGPSLLGVMEKIRTKLRVVKD